MTLSAKASKLNLLITVEKAPLTAQKVFREKGLKILVQNLCFSVSLALLNIYGETFLIVEVFFAK